MIRLYRTTFPTFPSLRHICAVGLVVFAISTSGCKSSQSYVERGNDLYAAGKYEDAALNYRNAIKKDSQSGEAYYRLGMALEKLNRGVEAYQNLNQAIHYSPENAAAKVQLATLCLAAYATDSRHPPVLYKQASSLTGEILAKNPNSSEGLRLKGAIALVDNRTADAVQAFQSALKIAPASRELSTDLAEALLKDNQREDGERAARAVIAKHPLYAPPYELLYSFYVSQRRNTDTEDLLKLWNANNPSDTMPALRLAAYYFRQQKISDSENMLNALLQRRASIPQVDLLVGDFHAMVHSWDKALADYQRGRSLDHAHELIYREREASTLAAMDRRDEALKAADAILSTDPKNLAAGVIKLQLLLRIGGADNLQNATAIAKRLAKDNPANARVQMLAGQAFWAKGDAESASGLFQQAIKADTGSVAPRLALAQLSVARKNYSAALEQADAVLAIKPEDPTAQLFRIIGLTGSGSYAQAKLEADRLARSTKNAAPVEMQLAIIALDQKNYTEAERLFRGLYREGDPNVYALAGLVNTYIGEHQSDRALELAQAELKRAPESNGKAALLVATAQAAGKPELALSVLQKMGTQNPNSAEVQIQIGVMERKQGHLPEALKAFQHARQLTPQRKGLEGMIGNIQEEAGQKTDAIASYRKALTETPDDAIILNNLAFLLTDTGGDLNEALRLATAASRKSPSTPAIDDTLAWIHIKQGNSAPMLPILTQLTRKDPSNATYRYHFAVALLQKGDRTSAKQQLEAALSEKPAKQIESDIRGLLAQIR